MWDNPHTVDFVCAVFYEINLYSEDGFKNCNNHCWSIVPLVPEVALFVADDEALLRKSLGEIDNEQGHKGR